MKSSIYRGLQQGAATRRNRYLRAAHRTRDLIVRWPSLSVEQARHIAQWDLNVETTWAIRDEHLKTAIADILRTRFEWQVRQARYHHAEWKKWAARNRQWQAELAAIDKQYGPGV